MLKVTNASQNVEVGYTSSIEVQPGDLTCTVQGDVTWIHVDPTAIMTFEIDANETEHTRDAIVNWVYNAPGGAQTTGSIHVWQSPTESTENIIF